MGFWRVGVADIAQNLNLNRHKVVGHDEVSVIFAKVSSYGRARKSIGRF